MLPDFRFHHIGIAVNNIDETAEIYLAAGYNKTDTVYDPLQHVHICFLNKDGMPTLELLAPEDDTSPVSKILTKNGVTPYHCCYEVDDIEDAMERLRKMRYIIVSKPLPAVAIDGRRVCFLFNKVVGLIEIVEK
jgi:methylmalonyl-CoA/ethylmalonyl-CoA epimerase